VRRIQLAVVLVVLLVVGVVLILVNAPAPGNQGGNLLENGGFQTGDLSGWQNSDITPAVESGLVDNATYAARFETTANGAALSQCTLHAQECATLNSSSISQSVSGLALSANTTLSLALYPSFKSPSIFQVTLSFTAPSQSSPEATVYYVVAASPDQCDAYGKLLTNSTQNSQAFCLQEQQGQWNVIARKISADLPAAPGQSALSGSVLTVSLSFAGANSTDVAYVDSVFVG